MGSAGALSAAWAASPPTLNLQVLLIGDGPTDATTAAWAGRAHAARACPTPRSTRPARYGSETVTLPTLSSAAPPATSTASCIADSPTAYAAGQLTALFAYESAFGVRQVDGYMYP